ncbi:E3 ubiquitin-protein ligase TRIM39-like [Lissotriton helveticus]
MAASQPEGNLQEEASCSICLEFSSDPVITECGHNFCRRCIMEYWRGPGGNASCPQCKEKHILQKLVANRQLANVVENIKQLQLTPKKALEGGLCTKHQEHMTLYCEEDLTAICVVCSMSEEHKSHTVIPIDEAAQDHKVKLQDWLSPLRKEMGYMLESKLREEEQYHTLRNKVRAEKQKIASEIEELHQLLREKEQTLYQRLEEMEKTITMEENANISKLSNQITSLEALIADLEKKCKEPALELLKDVRSTLDRCEEVKFLGPEKIKKYKVTVTLDPDTAHHELLLSEGGRRVRRTDTAQPLPDTPKRFTSCDTCVLGSEGFTSGRHYWEVQPLQEGWGWTVGVAAESVERKEEITWSPEGGVWAVERRVYDDNDDGQYSALTSPPTLLSPREEPLKLGVYLDYEGGRLSLYNGDSMELLYTFPRAPFTHRLFPIFRLYWGAELRLV